MADRGNFNAWYRTNYPRVLAVVLVVCRDLPRAEDASNDAFVKAYERWEKIAIMDSPTAWVTKVAVNNAKRSLRRRARHMELLNSQRFEAQVDDYWLPELREMLSVLTVRQRAAIVLRYVEQLSQAEVAEKLGVARGTASATLTQARSLLRTELEMVEVKDET